MKCYEEKTNQHCEQNSVIHLPSSRHVKRLICHSESLNCAAGNQLTSSMDVWKTRPTDTSLCWNKLERPAILLPFYIPGWSPLSPTNWFRTDSLHSCWLEKPNSCLHSEAFVSHQLWLANAISSRKCGKKTQKRNKGRCFIFSQNTSWSRESLL